MSKNEKTGIWNALTVIAAIYLVYTMINSTLSATTSIHQVYFQAKQASIWLSMIFFQIMVRK